MTLDELLPQIKNKKMILIGVLAVAGFLIANNAIVKPTLEQLRAIETEIDEARKKEPAIRALAELESQLEKHKSVFAQTKESAQIIEELSKIAASSGFTIQSINPEPTAKIGANIEKLSVRLDVLGSYHQLGNFVSEIESLKYFVKIARVEITNDQSGDSARPQARRNVSAGYRIGITVNLLYPAREAGA